MYYGWATKIHAIFCICLNIWFIASVKNVSLSIDDISFSKFYVAQVGMILYCFIVTALLVTLNIYHCALILENETTSEDQKDKYKSWNGNPYDMGASKNMSYCLR